MNAAAIAAALDQRKLDVLRYLLPAGRITGHEFCAGSLRGEEGKSLKVNINGKGCVWSDFATGDKGGDLLDLWAAVRCGGDIKAAMSESAEWLGVGGTASQTKAKPPGEPMQHPKPFVDQMAMGQYLVAQYHVRTPNEIQSCETCHR